MPIKKKRKRVRVEKNPKDNKAIVRAKPIYTIMLFGDATYIPTIRAGDIIGEFMRECEETHYGFNVMTIPEQKKDIAGRFMVQNYPRIVCQKNGEILGSIDAKDTKNNIMLRLQAIHKRAINLYK